MAEVQCDYCKGQGHIHRVFYGGARGGDGDYTCPKCNGSGVLAQPAPTAAAPTDGAVTGVPQPTFAVGDIVRVTGGVGVGMIGRIQEVGTAPRGYIYLVDTVPGDFKGSDELEPVDPRKVSLSEAAKLSRATYHRLLAEKEAAREAEAARNADPRDAELTRLRERAAEWSEIEDLLMERGELTPGVSLSKQVADLLSKLETRRDVLEAESDDLQAAVNAAVAGVENLSPLEALTRLLELRRRVSGGA